MTTIEFFPLILSILNHPFVYLIIFITLKDISFLLVLVCWQNFHFSCSGDFIISAVNFKMEVYSN